MVLDDSVDPQRVAATPWPKGSHLLFLYWATPDTWKPLQQQPGVTCHLLLDIVGGLAAWERRAADLAISLCNGGASLNGLPWRRLVEEPLYREALEIVALYDAFFLTHQLAASAPERWLTSARQELWRSLADGLEGTEDAMAEEDGTGSERAANQNQSTAPEGAGKPIRPRLWRRLARRLRRIMVTGDLRGQLWNLMDQLDPTYRRRLGWNRRRPRPRTTTQGIVFFSSYLNNSHLLRIVEEHLQETPHWLVTNRYARLATDGTAGRVEDLYRFADGPTLAPDDDVPLPDLEPLLAAWDDHQLPPAVLAGLLSAWLRRSPTWSYWQQRGQHALANLASCWLRYLELAQPKLIVMANQWSLEGWMTQLARQRGIPVLQVLHGILSGEYYTGRPVISDTLLVAGDFWRRLWPAEQRTPIRVLHLAGTFPTVEKRPPGDLLRLTYFSWPFDRLAFYNSKELLDGFIHLLQKLSSEGLCELTVRCHPLENPADLLDRWKQLYGQLPAGLRLSHQGTVQEVIAETDLAVMFRSTTMLDCLANGIPCLLPSWIDFTWQSQLEGVSGIHLATDFDDMAHTLAAWLRQPPVLDPEQVAPFLSPAADDDGLTLRRLVSELASLPAAEAPREGSP